MISVIITFFLAIILIRLIFRKIIDLPNYKGQSLADGSEFKDIMIESQFWEIIKTTRDLSKRNYELQYQLLTERLETFSSQQIIEFDRTFVVLMAKSYSFKLWEAAYALNGGCSDDAFEYFRSWLIGQGRNKFYWTIKFPRLLFLIGVKELIENYEGLAYCAMQAFESKTGNNIPSPSDIKYDEKGKPFSDIGAFVHYPELTLLAW